MSEHITIKGPLDDSGRTEANDYGLFIQTLRWKALGDVDAFAILEHPSLPNIGDPHPTLGADFIASRPRVTPIAGANNQAWVEIDFFQVGGGDIVLPNGGISTDRRSETIQLWRQQPVDPPEEWGGINLPLRGPQGDIGGTPVDAAGDPVDAPHIVHLIQVEIGVLPPFPEQLIFAIQNTRNNASWRGYNPGTVVYLGAQTRGRSGVITAVHQFAADNHFHMRQVPVRDASGNVLLEKEMDPQTEIEYTHAKYVNFHQPFRFTSNFDFLGIPFG